MSEEIERDEFGFYDSSVLDEIVPGHSTVTTWRGLLLSFRIASQVRQLEALAGGRQLGEAIATAQRAVDESKNDRERELAANELKRLTEDYDAQLKFITDERERLAAEERNDDARLKQKLEMK
jgi:Sec-independent protein translocase protein TatA